MVVLSTIEAEYMALTEAVKEAIWLRGLLTVNRVCAYTKVQSSVSTLWCANLVHLGTLTDTGYSHIIFLIHGEVLWRLKSSSGKGIEFDTLLGNFGGNGPKSNDVKRRDLVRVRGSKIKEFKNDGQGKVSWLEDEKENVANMIAAKDIEMNRRPPYWNALKWLEKLTKNKARDPYVFITKEVGFLILQNQEV
ncbi:hypothetical protein Tco_1297485 [Tanacetum coccineum]